jgi:hypothetical protein
MARYADYAKKQEEQHDQISSEITAAQDNAAERRENADTGFEMPSQFQGKTAEEIARSYVELQKLNSKQAQDLGTMRKLADQLLESPRQQEPPDSPPAASTEQEEPVTVDTLYENTEGTIARVAQKAVGGRVESLEKRLEERDRKDALAAFEAAHPDWKDKIQTDEFAEWAKAKPYRLQLVQSFDRYDFDAGDALFSMYEDEKGKAREDTQEREAERQQKLAAAKRETPSASTAGGKGKEGTYSRANLLKARLAAKRGDANARSWLQQHSEGIQRAYQEGLLTD